MLALFKRLADAEKVEDSVFKDTLYAKPEGGTVALLGQVCGRQLDTGFGAVHVVQRSETNR